MKFPFDFYTQYSQFYLADKISEKNTQGDFWNKDAYRDRLAINEGIIGVGTECYGPVKGELNVLEKRNTDADFSKYDHVVEGSIEIISGTLQILDCPNSDIHLEINLLPGWHTVRISSENLESVDGDEGDDFYTIEIWPENQIDRSVLKRFNS